jgi:CBS domain containing-hemolysin-like protein
LGTIPKEGQDVECWGLRFHTTKVTGHAVDTVLVSQTTPAEGATPHAVGEGSGG